MKPDPQVSSKHSLKVFACPPDYSPTRFFNRYCKQYVAPIYHMHLSEIGRSTNINAVQLWGWTFDQLADELVIKKDANDFGSYVAQRKEGTIPCASSRVSEVFKSAYLRVLDALWSVKLLDDASFRALSAIVCPVDFSFWDIGVIERPAWWPQGSTGKEGLKSSDEWRQTTDIALRDIDGRQLIFAAGPCSSPDEELQSVRFSLVPFAYRVSGPRLPTPERIAELLDLPTWSVDVMQAKPLSFFEVPLSEWEPSGQEGLRIGNLMLLPLLARIDSTNINCWQYWRGTNPLMFPTKLLAQGTATVGANDWHLEHDGKRAFSGYNWTQGPMQRLRFQFNQCGQFATAVFLGASLLVILAAIFSSGGKKSSTQAASKNQPPQPMVQDNTDNNVADLKNQLAAEKEKEQQQNALAATASGDPALRNATPAQQAAAAGYTPSGLPVGCVPGQPCGPNGYPQQPGGVSQLSPAQEEEQQIAAKDRERAYNARFSSNLAYSRPPDPPPSQTGSQTANPYALAANNTGMIAPRAAGEQPQAQQAAQTPERAPEVNIDSASGQPYVLYEGTTLDTVLMNRLDGDAVGPVKVLVSNPVYSHDHQHVIIPDGTIVLGEAKKIGSSGFGQQRRMAVAFHRMIMPDGYSVDLDQFHGLDQIGEEGLKDKVNNHYLEIFGASIALGVIAGAGEITQGGGVISTSGSQAFTTGAAGSVSQSATTILDRFIQIPPTITIREGHRVKVYFTQDMLLPAYTNHTIPQSF